MNDIKDELNRRRRINWLIFMTTVLNGALLIGWVLVQIGMQKFLGAVYATDQINWSIIITFRILFAIGTIYPMSLRLYTDIRIMHIKSKQEIEEAME